MRSKLLRRATQMELERKQSDAPFDANSGNKSSGEEGRCDE